MRGDLLEELVWVGTDQLIQQLTILEELEGWHRADTRGRCDISALVYVHLDERAVRVVLCQLQTSGVTRGGGVVRSCKGEPTGLTDAAPVRRLA